MSGVAVSGLDFKTISGEFGRPPRLRVLASHVRNQPASRALDARIALEIGWLRPYWETRENNGIVTGVITGDHFERYPLYATWYKHAPPVWWDDGAIICNRVPNLPQYSSDVGAAMTTIPSVAASASCKVILERAELWTIRVFGPGDEELIGVCSPGEESLAKALVLAGIDCLIRQLDYAKVASADSEYAART